MSIEALQKYHTAKKAYYEGNSIMSDQEFDALELSLAKIHPEILKLVGASERTGKEKLPTPMGSLDQIYNQAELDRWVKNFPSGSIFIVTDKLDGNSIELDFKAGLFVRSFSRGDGIMGANNTRHTQYISSVVKALSERISGQVRGELIVSKENWEIVQRMCAERGKDYKNARNFVAGFLNATESDRDLYPYIDFVAFDFISDGVEMSKKEVLGFLAKNGFKVPHYNSILSPSYDDLQAKVETYISNSEYELDGVVIDVDAAKSRDLTIDIDNLNPPYARKIKAPSKAASTTVTAIEWNVSKDGLYKPVVIFEPVQLTGVTITRASGYNAKNVIDNGMGVGAIVLITRQGDVIPRVDSVTVPVDVEIPAGCQWDANAVELLAPSSDATTMAMQQSQLEYFFDKMEIDFIGPGGVSKLMYAGIKTAEDAILNSDKFEEILGENGRKGEEVMRKRLAETNPALLFAALGSFGRGVGERKLKALFSKIPWRNVVSGEPPKVQQIIEVDGFDKTTADKIIENVPSAWLSYNKIKYDVTFVVKEKIVVTEGKFLGQIVCATGVRLDEDTVKKIELEGGEVTESFGKTVTLLVAKDPSSNSGKAAKARALGIKIVSLASLQDML